MAELYNGSGGTVQLIGDVSGYYLAGTVTTPGGYVPVGPSRVLDTRIGNGAPKAALGAGKTLELQATGRGGVPSSGVSAVALNVTVTQPSSAGYITVFGDGSARPTTSNLNFTKGQTIANLVIAPVGSDGKAELYNGSGGTVQLIADVSGYYLAGTVTTSGGYVPVRPYPSRLLDTRTGNGAPKAALGAGQTLALQVSGRGGVPYSGVSAVALNVTVTQPSSLGYITVFREASTRPTTSNLNFTKGKTIANLVIVPVLADGKVDLYNGSGGTVQLIADTAGYFTAT
jgi:hypothetical protein